MLMNFGEKMKSAYLERVKFREGVDLRLRLLAIDKVVAQQFHFLNFADDKGGKECIGGICCRAFGAPNQRYYVPCWVYFDPQRTYDGALQALALTPTQYEDFIKMEKEFRNGGYSITQFDCMSSTAATGKGTRTTFRMVTLEQSKLNYADQAFWKKIADSMEAFYALAEISLQQPMTPVSWQEVIQRNGVTLPDMAPNQMAALPPPAAAGVQQAFPGGAFGNTGIPTSLPGFPAGGQQGILGPAQGFGGFPQAQGFGGFPQAQGPTQHTGFPAPGPFQPINSGGQVSQPITNFPVQAQVAQQMMGQDFRQARPQAPDGFGAPPAQGASPFGGGFGGPPPGAFGGLPQGQQVPMGSGSPFGGAPAPIPQGSPLHGMGVADNGVVQAQVMSQEELDAMLPADAR